MPHRKIVNPFADRVEPIDARKGTFIKSFPIEEKRELLLFCQRTKLAMRVKDVPGNLVFTEVKFGKFNLSWQVYVMPEGVKYESIGPLRSQFQDSRKMGGRAMSLLWVLTRPCLGRWGQCPVRCSSGSGNSVLRSVCIQATSLANQSRTISHPDNQGGTSRKGNA